MNPNRPLECPFPNPPYFYRYFTVKGMTEGRSPQPPTIPFHYRVFGEEYNSKKVKILPSLGRFCQPQLYEKPRTMHEFKYELKRLNRSLMASFLDLIQILIENPESTERSEKLDQIRVLFINFHHLINELRPIQARSIIEATQKQHLLKLITILDAIRNGVSAAKSTLLMGKDFVKDCWILPKPRMVVPLDEEAIVARFKKVEFAKDLKNETDNPILKLVEAKLGSEKYNKAVVKHMMEKWSDPKDDEIEVSDESRSSDSDSDDSNNENL